jgi:hypothetical protein
VHVESWITDFEVCEGHPGQKIASLRCADIGPNQTREKVSVRYSEMDAFVTRSAQGDQVLFSIIPELAT